MKLLIVESPSKIKTIERYLTDDYKVVASYGHIVDLSTRGSSYLGIDLKTFTGNYVLDKDKNKVADLLKKTAKMADEVILATDPDREGEAIAYHLANLLKLDIDTTKRLEFHEITKDGILNALESPRTINKALFDSQEARRMLDRIVGFRLSVLLKNKINVASAGRVQSAVLKLIVDRENEIKAFIPEEYWNLKLNVSYDESNFIVSFVKSSSGLKKINNEKEKDAIVQSLGKSLVISEIKNETRKSNPKPPFTTSSLQQEVGSKFSYSSKKTAQIAQQLYEGIAIDGVETGLVTYIRSDSTRLSSSFVSNASSFITNVYGKEYLASGPAKAKSKANVQDAHEAIRPTNLELTPSKVKPFLSKEQYNMYSLIYSRTIASLMSPAKDNITRYLFETNGNEFSATSTIEEFPGYRKAYGSYEAKDEASLPTMKQNDVVDIVEVQAEQKFSEPPSRFSEGRLIKTMEEVGIGRPSTYATTIDTLKKRKYITILKSVITPTEEGHISIEALSKYFPELISSSYTAKMEDELDKIANVEVDKVDFLKAFYEDFSQQIESAKKEMPKIEPVKVGRTCPKCGGDLVHRNGKFGPFIACSNFPSCKHIENIVEYTGDNCPNCNSPLLYRYDGKGNKYIRCSDYKVCTYSKSLTKTNYYKKAAK